MNLLNRFVTQENFKSYSDFASNLKIITPENFNFAYDVADEMAALEPDKTAIVWCDDKGNEAILSFAETKRYSDKAANFFKEAGIKKGDPVMLILKRRYEFWYCLLALHKLGAICIPATQQPKVLIMDEPTSNLDYGNQLMVLNHVSRLAGNGMGILISSHVPDYALRYSTKTALMKKGCIEVCGDPDDVINSDSLHSLYGVNVKLTDVPLDDERCTKVCVPL
jgi:hypothetical protein